MFRKIRRIFSLRPADAVFAIRAYAYLWRSAWQLFVRKQSGAAIQANLDRINDSAIASGAGPSFDYTRAALWVTRAARVPFPWARCLQRSIALCMWMEREGLKPELKLGARKTAKGIDAHSWVEFGGRVINDSPSVRQTFGVFTSAQSARRVPANEETHST